MRSWCPTISKAILGLTKKEESATGGATDTVAATVLSTMLAVTAVLASRAVLLARTATTFGSMRRATGEGRNSKEREGE